MCLYALLRIYTRHTKDITYVWLHWINFGAKATTCCIIKEQRNEARLVGGRRGKEQLLEERRHILHLFLRATAHQRSEENCKVPPPIQGEQVYSDFVVVCSFLGC